MNIKNNKNPILNHVYRHIKTGNHYVFIGEALLEKDLTPYVVYVSVESGKTWLRPKSEFFDGRFINVPATLEKAG